jgi:hypothetical protein
MVKRLTILIFFTLIITLINKSQAQVDDSQLKSVLIERFSRFMEWPENMIDSVFVIEVLDNKEMYEIIKKTYANRKINNLPVQVTLLSSQKEYDHPMCHVLYVGNCYKENSTSIIEIYQQSGALVLGHEDRCLENGVTLAFISDGKKVVFGYDELALKRNKVSISYKLLQLAKNQ